MMLAHASRQALWTLAPCAVKRRSSDLGAIAGLDGYKLDELPPGAVPGSPLFAIDGTLAGLLVPTRSPPGARAFGPVAIASHVLAQFLRPVIPTVLVSAGAIGAPVAWPASEAPILTTSRPRPIHAREIP